MIKLPSPLGLTHSLPLVFGICLSLTAVKAFGQSAPYANTLPVTYTNPAVANMNGFASPNGLPTIAWFEWGTNYAWGSASEPMDVGDGGAVVHISHAFSNYVQGEVYQYRLITSNALGVATGAPMQFCSYGHTVGWGDNFYSQLNLYPDRNVDVTVAAGNGHSICLDRNGKVGVSGAFDNPGAEAFVPMGLSNVVDIAAGRYECLAVKQDGSVVAWTGHNWFHFVTNVPPGLSNVISISAGESHAVALRSDGTIFAWGRNLDGETNLPPGLSNVVEIASGRNYALALRDEGTVSGWGLNKGSVLESLSALSNVTAIAAGYQHALALHSDGTVAQWGTLAESVPLGLSNVIAIASGDYHCVALKADGAVVVWGDNASGQTTVPSNLPSVVQIGAGERNTLVVTKVPTLPKAALPWASSIKSSSARLQGFVTPNGFKSVAWFEWGLRGGEPANSTAPVELGNGTGVVFHGSDVTNLLAGAIYHCRLAVSNEVGITTSPLKAFTTGQRVIAWGQNDNGQTDVPAGLSNVVLLGVGEQHALALTSDGKILGWGLNNYGQTDPPADLTNVTALAAGRDHSLALLEDGHIVAWGRANQVAGVPVGLSNVVSIDARVGSNLALRSDGSVTSWGLVGFPPLPSAFNIVSIAASYNGCLAVRDDGTYWSWGISRNDTIPHSERYSCVDAYTGNLIGLRTDRQLEASFYPVPIGLTNALAISAGKESYYAVDIEGTVFAWGSGRFGPTNVPPGLANASLVDGAQYCAYALGPDVPYIIGDGSVSGYANRDIAIRLSAHDPNGDPLTFRIASLPTAGSLYQYDAGVRGDPINAPNGVIEDPLGQVIYAPATNAFGSPYSMFKFLVNDGVADSASATVTVDINLPPVPEVDPIASGWSTSIPGAFELNFSGGTDATYSAYASTNLLDWEWLGFAEPVSAGVYLYLDSEATNAPQRFYKVGAP